MGQNISTTRYVLRRTPWFGIACWLAFGAGGIYVASLDKVARDPVLFRIFLGMGVVTVVGASLLPKTVLVFDKERQEWTRTWSAWTGFWKRTAVYPLKTVAAVCYYRVVTNRRKGFRQEFFLSVVNEGLENILLFPRGGYTPGNAATIGKELAGWLGVEYRENL